MKKLYIFIALIFLHFNSYAQSPDWMWVKTMNSSANSFHSAGKSSRVDNAGNIYTIGNFLGTVDFDPNGGTFNLISNGGTDIFISKLDNLGNFIWAKQIGSNGNDNAQCINVTSDNYICLTGYYSGTPDFDPNSGTFNLTSVGGNDIFVAKLDISSNFIFAKSFGGSDNDNALSIINDSLGNIYFTGHYKGVCDFDPGVGTYNLTSLGGREIFVSKLDALGDLLWIKSAGGVSDDIGSSLQLDNTNHLYLFGQTTSPTANFDTITFSTTSPASLFIGKLDMNQLEIPENLISSKISVFPNPFSHQCTVNFVEEQFNTNVKIMDFWKRKKRYKL